MLMQSKVILVAVDASPRAQQVVEAASELAQKLGGKIVLFRAVGIPVELPPEAFVESPNGLVGVLERHAEENLRTIASTIPAGLHLKSVVQEGTPWRSICAAAVELAADMIIIGSHGFSALDRLLGTTAARVVNHAGCAVLVVRARDATPAK